MKIGAQLYTLRNYTQNEKDFAFSIEKVAKMGYETVQISAIGKDIKPQRVREICDGEVGIKNLHFGNIRTDITAKDGNCNVVSNGRAYIVNAGKQYFTL